MCRTSIAACALVAILAALSGATAQYTEAIGSGDYIPPDVQFPGTYRHTVEVRSDGMVWVSGRNDFGQLADGTTINRGSPQKVKASSARFVPDLPVMLNGLGPREPESLDLLDGQAGLMQEYDYASRRWIVRMNDYDGNVRLLYANPEELEVALVLDPDVPSVPTPPATVVSSRRRSGCRITTEERENAFIIHDDATYNWIEAPNSPECISSALVMPDESMRMFLPRYGLKEGYALSDTDSELACLYAPPCSACNTFDEDEECPNDALACNPPLGKWQHEQCRLKFTPGATVYARQLRITPQVELNRRTGFLTQLDTRYGVEWEVKLSPIFCQSSNCDSGNVLSVQLPLHLIERNGDAYEAAAGAFHTVFLWTDFSVGAVGKNSEGQLGDGTRQNRVFPQFILSGAKSVAAGYYHSLYLLKNGTVMAAGRNTEGQLGDGTSITRISPVWVIDGVKQIAAGAFHSVFLMEDDTVQATGLNTYGQLGDGGAITTRRPVATLFNNVQSIRTGDFYTLFVTYDPIEGVTNLWSAGMFDAGLGRSKASWSTLQFFNQSEVERMAVVM